MEEDFTTFVRRFARNTENQIPGRGAVYICPSCGIAFSTVNEVGLHLRAVRGHMADMNNIFTVIQFSLKILLLTEPAISTNMRMSVITSTEEVEDTGNEQDDSSGVATSYYDVSGDHVCSQHQDGGTTEDNSESLTYYSAGQLSHHEDEVLEEEDRRPLWKIEARGLGILNCCIFTVLVLPRVFAILIKVLIH
ncbi:hypothetical protein L1049_009005 [Liquidambar formosana]|uniref:C2H2-type domain-containing protein n=1 Tax=Liquidambar formosana TaxID=63359 RepID=A0AAP0X620_LIQFO